MTIESPPLYIQADTYPARLDRFPLAVMYDEGVMKPTHCKVSQRGAGANFSVDIAVGTFVVQGDDQSLQGNYMGRVTATENVAIGAAPGSNSRYDLVTLRVNDPNAGGNAGSNVTVVVVAGTAAASPSVPALPASSIPLAVIGPIATATSSITTSLIHDVWSGTGPAFAASCRRLAGRVGSPGQLDLYAAGPDKINGWLYCDGSAVSRTTYADLFAMFNTQYGVGDGSTTFNLPDLRNRMPVAFGTSFGTVGGVGGEINHALSIAELAAHDHGGGTSNETATHTHSGSTSADGAHSHDLDRVDNSQAGSIKNVAFAAAGSAATGLQTVNPWNPASASTVHASASADSNHAHAFSTGTESAPHSHVIGSQGSGTAHNNMPPYQVMSGWAIRT